MPMHRCQWIEFLKVASLETALHVVVILAPDLVMLCMWSSCSSWTWVELSHWGNCRFEGITMNTGWAISGFFSCISLHHVWALHLWVEWSVGTDDWVLLDVQHRSCAQLGSRIYGLWHAFLIFNCIISACWQYFQNSWAFFIILLKTSFIGEEAWT